MSSPSCAELEARVSDPFFSRSLEQFNSLRKLYVSADDPRASDGNDGSAEHPYRSFQPAAARIITPGTAVIVAPGAYTVPDGGLSLTGAVGFPAILLGIPGRPKPILDARPFSLTGSGIPATEGDIRVRQVVDVSGSHCMVEGMDLRYGFRHNVVFRGRRSILRYSYLTGAFEDAIKIANTPEDPTGADTGLIRENVVVGFTSQGVDLFGASDWLIVGNDFSHPHPDPSTGIITGQGVGLKGGAKRVIVSRNRIHDMLGAPAEGAIELGGAGTNFSVSTEDCIATDNLISGYNGPGVVLSSVLRGQAYRNRVDGVIGIRVGIDPDVRLTVPNMPTCREVALGDNVLTTPAASGAAIHMAANEDALRFVSGGNKYYTGSRFLQINVVLTWPQFCAAFDTDRNSLVL